MSSNIVDTLVSGGAAHEIAQEIKDSLYAKAVDRVDTYREVAAANLFGGEVAETEDWLDFDSIICP